MALIKLAGRIRRTQLKLFLPLIPCPTLHPPFTSSQIIYSNYCSTSPYHLSPFRSPLHKHHFSSFARFPYYDSSDFETDGDEHSNPKEPGLDRFLEILKQAKQFTSEGDAMASLDQSGVRPSVGLLYSAIWALKREPELAFLAFNWGEKWGCKSPRVWELMIWILGKQRSFSVAWSLIKDMHRYSMATQRAILIMIDRYAAANNPSKAIKAFLAMDKFRITPDSKTYFTFLHTLCKHGNIEEAEEFMLQNKKLFPLETQSFNIILNGWCNISVDILEAKRVWREMSCYCVTPNATSYTHMISCFSKIGNLFDSLRLYDEMKKRGWVPNLEVYNSLIHVLTRENCMTEALKLVDKIKEAGLQPDSTTYNSMILPLCEAQKQEQAKRLLVDMVTEGINPTTITYHAFIKGINIEGALELLGQMREVSCGPNSHTFLLILNNFFRLKQPDNAVKIWMEMEKYIIIPDSASYIVLVQGLATCGWIMKGREFYSEMRSRGFVEDPKLEMLLKDPEGGDKSQEEPVKKKSDDIQANCSRDKTRRRRIQRQRKKENSTL
ncbi:pentatricopeptide repeat-containing protein At1g80880, mitochondrial-like [Telopea speciosissima]|uniref:pentatricopeptide repeat-containing protein At1g80880, mitochondrial-like n=1 Tax=Telopea speciosissima TaxID=54955 RepID=UPI001CC5A48D|nr:pentatricopeptide repeat-containing protein At1g80880, mitochondrial-like [Telopea speciosissima]